MKRIDLKVGFACNNMCKFCVQGDKRFRYRPRSKDEIFANLKEGLDEGNEGVLFTGGEPTVHPDILDSIRYAKSIGYKSIHLQSNGRTFSDIEYCKRLIDAGVTEFGPSIHGFTPSIHDELVQRPGAWKEVVTGLKNLQKLNQLVITNTVITKQNYSELPKLIMLLVSLGVKQFQLAFIHILGSADDFKLDIVPKKSDIMPFIHKSLDIGNKYGLVCMTEAIPYCFMRGYEWAIAETNYIPETAVFDAEQKIESYTDYRWNEGKSKGKPCENCAMKDVCEGPWKEYPLLYGRDEFIPFNEQVQENHMK